LKSRSRTSWIIVAFTILIVFYVFVYANAPLIESPTAYTTTVYNTTTTTITKTTTVTIIVSTASTITTTKSEPPEPYS